MKVTATNQIAAMYIRKQNIFTKKKVYPYLSIEELRLDLLPRIRVMARNHAMGSHPWSELSDEELLRSAGLYGIDHMTGQRGYNLAAVMLLGRDEVIQDVAPAYVTDALVRKVNVDRYDDREIVKTNLIESCDRLMEFARKHLPDKFFLEDTQRVSLRNIIVREMLVNTLIHREFTSSFIDKFIIEEKRMYVENANRASREGLITPDNMEPNPKNPLIASFFRNIGYSDQLGSGVRKLFKYTKFYSNGNPQLVEGDIFRIIVPLDDTYSFDQSVGNTDSNDGKSDGKSDGKQVLDSLNDTQKKIMQEIIYNPHITQEKLAIQLDMSLNGIRTSIRKLRNLGVLRREGSHRSGIWKIILQDDNVKL